MVDDVDGDRPALALDEQLSHELRRDRGRRYPIDPLPTVRLSPRNEVIASHKIDTEVFRASSSMRLRRWLERRERRRRNLTHGLSDSQLRRGHSRTLAHSTVSS